MTSKQGRTLRVSLTDPPGDAQLAPAVQFLVSAGSMVVEVFDAQRAFQEEAGFVAGGGETASEQVLRRWLSLLCELVRARRLSASCRTILVGAHVEQVDVGGQQGGQAASEAVQASPGRRLVPNLRRDCGDAGLQARVVLVHALVAEQVHELVWSEVFLVADELVRGVEVPKCLNELPAQLAAFGSRRPAASSSSSAGPRQLPPVCLPLDEFLRRLSLPASGSLSAGEAGRALAALRRCGSVLQLPGGSVFLQPRYFASAVHAVMGERLIPEATVPGGRVTRRALADALLACPTLGSAALDDEAAVHLVSFLEQVDVFMAVQSVPDELLVPSRLVGLLFVRVFPSLACAVEL